MTRLTVYRHFPDQEELFEAGAAQWAREHPRRRLRAARRLDVPPGA